MEVFLRFAETVFGLLACLSVGVIVAVIGVVGYYPFWRDKNEKMPPIRQEVEDDFKKRIGNGLATDRKSFPLYLGIIRHLELDPMTEYFWLKRREWEPVTEPRTVWRNPFTSPKYYYRRVLKYPEPLTKVVRGETSRRGWKIEVKVKVDYSIPEPTKNNLTELQKLMESLSAEPLRARLENQIERDLLKLIRNFPEEELLNGPNAGRTPTKLDEEVTVGIKEAAQALGLKVVQSPSVDIKVDEKLTEAKQEPSISIYQVRSELIKSLPKMLQEDRSELRKLLVDKMTELMVASIKYDRKDAAMIAQQVVGQAWQSIGNTPFAPSILSFLSTGNLSNAGEMTDGNLTVFSQDSVKQLLEGPLAAESVIEEHGQVVGVSMSSGITVRVDRGLNNIEVTYPNTRPYPFPLPSSQVPWPEDIPRNWALLLYGMGVVAGIREASRRSK